MLNRVGEVALIHGRRGFIWAHKSDSSLDSFWHMDWKLYGTQLNGCFKSNKILINPNYIRTRLDLKR